MTFASGTAAQFARAAALIRATDTEERRIHNLRRLVRLAQLEADERGRQLGQRTCFFVHPAALGGAIELYRRAGPKTRQSMRSTYHLLLELMLEASAPGMKPGKMDFAALPVAARPYLLAPFLGLVVGKSHPYLDFDRSDPARGHFVFIHAGGPADPVFWRERLPSISAWLDSNIQLGTHDATSITLVRRDDLPAILPMNAAWLRPHQLFLGIDTQTHSPVHIPFAALPSGTLVVGRSGSGKSNATHLILQSVLSSLDLFQAVFLIDGKQGHTFRRYRSHRTDKIYFLTEEPDVWRLMRGLAEVVQVRNRRLAEAGLETAPNDLIAVFIEEMSAYTAKPATDDKADVKAHTQFVNDLVALARRGRSAGLKLIITVQDPTDDQVPTRVRANCQLLLAFKTPIDTHATMLMGSLAPENDPRTLATGRARLRHDSGDMQTVQFPLAVDPARPKP